MPRAGCMIQEIDKGEMGDGLQDTVWNNLTNLTFKVITPRNLSIRIAYEGSTWSSSRFSNTKKMCVSPYVIIYRGV